MKKFVRNPWFLGIGTTVVGGVILSFVLDWIKGVDLLSTLKTVLNFIGDFIVSCLNFELKVWWLLIAVALIILGLFVMAKVSKVKHQNAPPFFLTYKKDFLLGYTWEWEYTKGYDGKYSISNLHPICSECEMILKQCGSYGSQMECLRCGKTKQWTNSLRDDARMLIEDNIKKSYLQNHQKEI